MSAIPGKNEADLLPGEEAEYVRKHLGDILPSGLDLGPQPNKEKYISLLNQLKESAIPNLSNSRGYKDTLDKLTYFETLINFFASPSEGTITGEKSFGLVLKLYQFGVENEIHKKDENVQLNFITYSQ